MKRPTTVNRVSRLPLGIAGVIVGLMLLATIALIATRGTTTFDEGTPEATLQQYLVAAFDGNEDAMLDRLTTTSSERCRQEMLDTFGWNDWPGQELRADLRTIEDRSDGAVVATVRFDEGSSGDPFGSSWSYEHTFILMEEDAGWLIERAGWPHQFQSCTRGSS